MKIILKKFSILGLIGFFLFSIMMCCCLTNIAKAQEPQPSCHQAAHETGSSQSATEDCDCEDSIATLTDIFILKTSLTQITVFSSGPRHNDVIPIVARVDAYQAPPSIHQAIPIYLKHSILRI